MDNISFFNETNEVVKDEQLLTEIAKYALKKEQIENAYFNVIFVDNDYIKNINRDYRGKDVATDVITFALEDNEDVKLEIRILGDIFISLDKASEQAIEYNHSLTRELAFLLVHGFYHLLGYDHMTNEEEKIMMAKQEEVLNEFGIHR